MGSFVTQSTTPTLFDDKAPAPGISLPTGWTLDNITRATDLNAIKEALLDARAAVRALRTEATNNGAVGDGVTDDNTAIQNTQDAATTLKPHFSTGSYLVSGSGLVLRAPSGSTYSGDGMHASTLKRADSGYIVQSSSSFPRKNVVFEDLCFDNNSAAIGGLLLYGEHVQNVIIRRCKFLVSASSYGILLAGVNRVVVEDCEFYGAATNNSVAISLSGGAQSVTIRRNKFRFCYAGCVADTGTSIVDADEDTIKWLKFVDNDCDMGFWAWPSKLSGSLATFTGNSGLVPPTGVMTSGAGGFNSAGLTQYDMFRVLEVRRSSTITSCDSASLTDSGATFTGTLRGDIVRVAGKFAFVEGVKSATNLRIEGWIDSTTYQETSPPVAATAYTLYKVIHGRVNTWTDTQITTYDGFWDMEGDAVVPVDHTLFELYNRSNYHFHVEFASRNTVVRGNKFARGYADQCSIYGNRALVTHNDFLFSHDVHCTVNGTSGDGHSLVSNNRFERSGGSSIFLGTADNVLVSTNQIHAPCWTNKVNLYTSGGMTIQGSTNCHISNNMVDGENREWSRCGIGLNAQIVDGLSNAGITLQGNRCFGTFSGGIHLRGPNSTGIIIDYNPGTSVVTSDSAPGGYWGRLHHADQGVTGTPEGAVVAGPGTRYWASTDVEYIKTSGTSSTGWVVFSGSNTGDVTLGTTNGLSLVAQALSLDAASASGPGAVTTTTQTIGGAKTFNTLSTFASGLTATDGKVTTLTAIPNTGMPGSVVGYQSRLLERTDKITIPATAFVNAAHDGDLLVFTLEEGTAITELVCRTTVGFTGAGTTYAIKLGKAIAGNEYILSHSVLSPVVKGLDEADYGASLSASKVHVEDWAADSSIYIRLSSDQNLGNGSASSMTTGSITIYLTYRVF